MQKTCKTGNYSFLNSCFVVLYFRYKFIEMAQHDGRYQVYVEHRLALGFMPLAFLKIRDTEEICCSVFSVFDTSYSPFGVCCWKKENEEGDFKNKDYLSAFHFPVFHLN